MRKFLLILIILATGCAKKPNNNLSKEEALRTATILGNSKELIGSTIYLKDNNHFNFLTEEFIMDSTVVDSDGNFKFEIELKESRLVKIDSSAKYMPGTLLIFKNDLQHYQYLLCKNFLAYHPTLFIEPSKAYFIESWENSHDLNAVVYKDENHNYLRRYYTENPYYDTVRQNGELRDIRIEEAWGRVNIVKDSLVKVLELNDEIEVGSFKHYLKSEIVLGASNWFFNWFDAKELDNYNHSSYKEALSIYNEEEWNKASLHYFKVTERLINTKLNEKYNSFKVYYEPSRDKLEMATKYAGENIVEQYSNNIKRLLE